jgi:hypothetical protein
MVHLAAITFRERKPDVSEAGLNDVSIVECQLFCIFNNTNIRKQVVVNVNAGLVIKTH